MTTTITYDEFGVLYDAACFLYDGIDICHPPPPTPVVPGTRPRYWAGISGRTKPKPKHFISVAIQTKCLSVNGFDVDFDLCDVRFAGEEDKEVKVKVYPIEFNVAEETFKVDSIALATHPIDPTVVFKGVREGEVLPETEGAFLGSVDGQEITPEEDKDFFVEAMVLTGSSEDLTFSCSAIETIATIVSSSLSTKSE